MDPKLDQWTEEKLSSLHADVIVNPEQGMRRLEMRMAARTRTRWAAGAAVAVIASVAAFPASRTFAARCIDACVQEASYITGGVRPAENNLAPNFTLRDSAGKAVSLSDFRGQVVVVNFWATWCAPCRVEIPWFIEFQKSRSGLTVLGVSFDDGWNEITPFVAKHNVNYPVVLGDEAVARLYGADRLPQTLIVDRDGRIARSFTGLAAKREYAAAIDTLLAGH